MKVVILCGGQGTRLREETEFRPKPMVEIGGRPILWHIMKIYAHHGLTDFVLCLGYKGHVIKQYFLNYDALTRDLTVQLGRNNRTELLEPAAEDGWTITMAETGISTQTGARLRKVRRYVEGDSFCLTYGDGLGAVDVQRLLKFHKAHGRIATVTGVRPPGRFGELNVAGDSVQSFVEKPQVSQGLINGGFFVFEPALFDKYLPDSDELVLEGAPLRQLAEDKQLMVYCHEGFWQPMDTYREWKLLENLWESGEAPWKVWA